MTDLEEEESSESFRWTPGKVILIELTLLCIGIIGLVPIAFTGLGLSAAKESAVPWWFDLYFGDIALIALSIAAIPITGLIAFIMRLARD